MVAYKRWFCCESVYMIVKYQIHCAWTQKRVRFIHKKKIKKSIQYAQQPRAYTSMGDKTKTGEQEGIHANRIASDLYTVSMCIPKKIKRMSTHKTSS